MNLRRISTAKRALDASLQAVPSKSVTHRALVAAALATGKSTIRHPLDADDTHVTRGGLAAVGIRIESLPDRWIVHGRSGDVPGGAKVSLQESGTSLRFLLAVAATGTAASRLDGAQRLRERPIRELASALEALGGFVRLGRTGGLPLDAGGRALQGGSVRLPGAPSSQFASALLLIGSRLPGGLDLTIDPPIVSAPYIRLTARVLEQFGVRIERIEEGRWRVEPGEYSGREYSVEGDHSSASYFLAAAAVAGGRVRVAGLAPDSEQADRRLSSILRDLGCTVRTGEDWIEAESDRGSVPGFDLDLADAPDLVPTLAMLALFAEGPSALRGIAHLRAKESDRLEVLAQNLRTLGRVAVAGEDRLEIGPRKAPPRGGTVVTASDHRIAMAFAVAGLAVKGLTLDDAECVAKSNPLFWEQFGELEGDSA